MIIIPTDHQMQGQSIDIGQKTLDWLREREDPDSPPRVVQIGATLGTTISAATSIGTFGQGLVPNTLASLNTRFTNGILRNYSTRVKYLTLGALTAVGYIFDTTILGRPYLDMKQLVVTPLTSELILKGSAKDLKKCMRPPKDKKGSKDENFPLTQIEYDPEAALGELQQLAKIAMETQSLSGPLAGGPNDPICNYLFEIENPKSKRPAKATRWGVLALAQITAICSVLASGQGVTSAATGRIVERLGKVEVKDLSLKAELTATTVYLAAALAFDMFVLKRSFTQPKDWVAASLALSFGLGRLARLLQRAVDPNSKVPKPIPLSGIESDPSCQCSDWDWRTWVYKRTSAGKPPHLVRAGILASLTSASVATIAISGQGLVSKTLSAFGSRVIRTETREWSKKILYAALLTYIASSMIFDVFALGKSPLNYAALAAFPLALDLFIKVGIRHLELLLNPNSVDDDDDDEQVEKKPKEKNEKKIKSQITELTDQIEQMTISPAPGVAAIWPSTCVINGLADPMSPLRSNSPISSSGSASPEEASSDLEIAALASGMSKLKIESGVDTVTTE